MLVEGIEGTNRKDQKITKEPNNNFKVYETYLI